MSWAIVATAQGVTVVYAPFKTWEDANVWGQTFRDGPTTWDIVPLHEPSSR